MNEENQLPGSDMEFPQLDELVLTEQKVDEVVDSKKRAQLVCFIGAGQGGCKIADTFYNAGYNRTLLVNTTNQDMAGLKCPNQVIIGVSGQGAGKDPKVGEKAAKNNYEKILRECKKAFGANIDRIIVTVGGGGGTGTGSCETLIEVAKDYLTSLNKPAKVGVLLTLPKKTEGAAVMKNATDLFAKVTELNAAPIMVFDNDKILRMFPNASISNFFKIANSNMVGLFNVFNELSAQPSAHATLDPADYSSILDSGVIVFGMTPLSKFEDKTAIAEAIEKNLQRGLFVDGFSVKGATHAGAILVGSDAMLGKIPQSAFEAAFETLSRTVGGNLMVHSGIYAGPDSLGEKVMLYTILGGLKKQ